MASLLLVEITTRERLLFWIPLHGLLVENVTSHHRQPEKVVAARGYYPADVKIKDYDKDFIDGCLIGAWQQVYGMIKEMKEKEVIPFN